MCGEELPTHSKDSSLGSLIRPPHHPPMGVRSKIYVVTFFSFDYITRGHPENCTHPTVERLRYATGILDVQFLFFTIYYNKLLYNKLLISSDAIIIYNVEYSDGHLCHF